MPRSSSSESQADRLESEKDHLTLQVSVLKDQIDAQAEKIHDLERSLDEKRVAVSMLSNGDAFKVSNHGNRRHRASSQSRMDGFWFCCCDLFWHVLCCYLHDVHLLHAMHGSYLFCIGFVRCVQVCLL